MVGAVTYRLLNKIVVVAFGLFLAQANPVQAQVFNPETYTLANGLQIVVVHNNLSPAVVHMVWYKVGAIDDPTHKSGLAHYLEHMMFKRSLNMPTGSFSAVIAAKGGMENAFTTYDYTAYHEEVAAAHLAMVMQMEAERMRNLQMDPQEALSERAVVLSERQERTENDPHGLFFEKLRATFFQGHPYGRPVIGWREEIEMISFKDTLAYYHHYYAPNNALLVISGNVETADVLRLAAGTFGRLPAQEGITRQQIGAMRIPTQKRVEMQDSRVTQPFVIRQIALPRTGKTSRESYALEVLAELLSSGEVGLLYRHFVMDKHVASNIAASYNSTTRGPVLFTFSGVPVAGQEVRMLETQVNAYMWRLKEKGVRAADVAAAQQRMLDSAVFARDRLMAPAQILGSALATGQTVRDVEQWPHRIRAVTTDEVNAALCALLVSPYEITGVLEPVPEGAHK